MAFTGPMMLPEIDPQVKNPPLELVTAFVPESVMTEGSGTRKRSCERLEFEVLEVVGVPMPQFAVKPPASGWMHAAAGHPVWSTVVEAAQHPAPQTGRRCSRSW